MKKNGGGKSHATVPLNGVETLIGIFIKFTFGKRHTLKVELVTRMLRKLIRN